MLSEDCDNVSFLFFSLKILIFSCFCLVCRTVTILVIFSRCTLVSRVQLRYGAQLFGFRCVGSIFLIRLWKDVSWRYPSIGLRWLDRCGSLPNRKQKASLSFLASSWGRMGWLKFRMKFSFRVDPKCLYLCL